VNYFTILSKCLSNTPVLRSNGARSHASGAAEPDGHLIAVDNHRHGAAPVAEGQHALQVGRVAFDVDVLERNLPPAKILTGGLRIRSSVLAEDVHHPSILRVDPGTGSAI
jgi:hypothetical protein